MELEKVNNKILRNICEIAIENKENIENDKKLNKMKIEHLSNILKENNLISEMEICCAAIDKAINNESIEPLYDFNLYLISKIFLILENRNKLKK